ncbi:type II secretion system minor pseudopilin GspK [Croceicoccus marinus]|uniref:Type II secretion system protein K n=1 Tax=Croceicoccus marinus TaxID=450378 RepID=A0A7G6VXH5_9SPHN|nr:type II secretion system minor pseudopilin GspK [Croceicoccus marinus]QNE06440.1 type II secretion system minor pseudopilin GspK [Croceicoccus marinus]
MTEAAARKDWFASQGRGAALLSVLVLVALMSIIATLMLDRLNLATRLASNSQAMAQAQLYAASAEQITAARLTQLVGADEEKTVDRIGLLGREQAMPLARGSVAVTVTDAQNCFNVNSLGAGADGEGRRFDRRAQGQFLRLMEGLAIPANEAVVIADSVGDWTDRDQSPQPNGAEDDYYLSLPVPYRTPGRAIGELSELRAVRGMTEPIYRRLLPWVCALPTGGDALVNVNTLRPDQARLISAMTAGSLSVDRARAFIASRPAGGWSSVSGAVGQMARGDDSVFGPAALSQMSVRSELFAARIAVRVDSVLLEETALIDVSDPPGRVVVRSWGAAQ